MIESMVSGLTLPEAYHNALDELDVRGSIVPCPDYNTTQKEISMTFVVTRPLTEPMISKLFIGGPRELEQYRLEMLDGILDFEIEKGNWVYTYHRRIEDQIPFIIDELTRNPYSRRAVITVRDKEVDMHTDDPACLQHIQYFVRNGKLDCKVLFRSNDACKASFMNAFALIMLQKRIADALNLEVGWYVHRANSYHCYEKDFDMLKGYIKKIYTEPIEDLTYDYEGEWAEYMEAEREGILKSVEELKNR